MSLNTTKASTEDNTNGTPVATITPEVGTPAIQATAAVGHKTTWSETSRTGLTAADAPTGGDMTTTGFAGSAGANLFDCENSMSVSVRATCDTASKSLTGRIAFYDGSNNCLGYSEQMTFASDATLRLGNAAGNFIAQRQVIDAGAARKAEFLVTSMSGGTWSVYCRPI